MTESLFDPAKSRRPEFDPESVPVEFGSLVFHLPKPRVSIRRRHNPDGSSVGEPTRSFGADFERLVDKVAEAAGGGSIQALAAALFDLAADLIRRNYAIAEEELDQVLSLDPAAFGGDSIPEPWATVWGVAVGLPKAKGPGPSQPV